MHIIVDIRTSSVHDTLVVRAGIAWANLWKKHKTEDTLSLLIYPHQEKIDGYNCLVVPQPFGIWGKKKLRPKTGKEIFRCVSFSGMLPYDSTIPTISHIWSNAESLYPPVGQNSLMRRLTDYQRKYILRSMTTLIVPDIQIGSELVEIYDIQEDHIEIIPHIPFAQITERAPLQSIQTDVPFFLYDGSYGNEANLLTLLAAWERYRHDGGTYQLLMIGAVYDGLSSLTHMIRSLDLHESVRYLGTLDEGTMHHLYRKTKGWIYTGSYYSNGPQIELALAYDIPLLLSDITSLESYPGIKVHPNHKADIAVGLKKLESLVSASKIVHHEHSYIDAYTKILAKRK